MNSSALTNVPRWIWFGLMIAGIAISPYIYLIETEAWYFTVFESTRNKAGEHYAATKTRYYGLTAGIVCIVIFHILWKTLYNETNTIFTPHLFSIVNTVVLFMALLLTVWQIVILLNAYSYTQEGDNFKNSRAKYLLYLVFAPIGVWKI